MAPPFHSVTGYTIITSPSSLNKARVGLPSSFTPVRLLAHGIVPALIDAPTPIMSSRLSMFRLNVMGEWPSLKTRPPQRTRNYSMKQRARRDSLGSPDTTRSCDGRVAESEDSTTTTHTQLQCETTCVKGQPRVTRHHRKTYVDRTIMCNPFHHSGQFFCSILEQSTGLGRLNPQRRL